MKYLSGVCLGILLSGCGSSSSGGGGNNTANALVGTWLSNCHLYEGVEAENGDPVYAISQLTIEEATYVDLVSSFSDMDCVTSDGEADETFTSSFALGDDVTASDGLAATRITLTAVVPDRPELELVTQAVYRLTETELNFAEFAEETAPEFDYRITYIRQ